MSIWPDQSMSDLKMFPLFGYYLMEGRGWEKVRNKWKKNWSIISYILISISLTIICQCIHIFLVIYNFYYHFLISGNRKGPTMGVYHFCTQLDECMFLGFFQQNNPLSNDNGLCNSPDWHVSINLSDNTPQTMAIEVSEYI